VLYVVASNCIETIYNEMLFPPSKPRECVAEMWRKSRKSRCKFMEILKDLFSFNMFCGENYPYLRKNK